MVAVGHPGQRGHRLALRPRADQADLVGRQPLEVLHVDHEPLGDVEVAEVAGDAHVADHRAADEGDLAPVLVSGVEDLLDAVHVTGEAGHDHALRRGAEHLVDRRGQLLLRCREAGYLGVRRVGEEEVHALLGQPRERPQVGDATVQRELVHLEVTGVQHQAGGGADRDSQAVRDRVVDRDELAVERAQRLPLPLADLDGLRGDPVLLELGRDEGQREPGPDQGDVRPLAQQVRHGADVVLVPVREHDRVDLVEPAADPGEVGQDHVDARLVLLGEEHPAVDDQQPAGVLVDRHVAADLPQAAQRHHAQAARRQGGECVLAPRTAPAHRATLPRIPVVLVRRSG